MRTAMGLWQQQRKQAHLRVCAACWPFTSTRRAPSSLKTLREVPWPLMEHLQRAKSCSVCYF